MNVISSKNSENPNENYFKIKGILESSIQKIRELNTSVFTAEDLISSSDPQVPKLLDPLFPSVGIGALVGGSDTGKSSFLRQLAISIVTKENDFLGYSINAKYNKALYISSEDDKYALRELLKIQCAGKSHPPELYRELRFICDTDNLINKIRYEIEKCPVDIIIIDAFADLFTGNLNQASEVRSFLNQHSKKI